MQLIKNHRLTAKSNSVLLSIDHQTIKKQTNKILEPCGYQHSRGEMLIRHTPHLPAHTNVSETSTWAWDQVLSSNSLRNIIIIPSSSPLLSKEHQYLLFFKGSKWVCPSHPQSDPEHSFWVFCCSILLAQDTLPLPQDLFRVSASAWSILLSHSRGSELLTKTQYCFST